LEACRELGVSILAYSPLGRGMLTGNYKGKSDFASNDWRTQGYPIISSDNIDSNLELVKVITGIAEKKKEFLLDKLPLHIFYQKEKILFHYLEQQKRRIWMIILEV